MSTPIDWRYMPVGACHEEAIHDDKLREFSRTFPVCRNFADVEAVIRAAEERGRREEREACLELAEQFWEPDRQGCPSMAQRIIDAIRARGGEA